MANPAVLDIDMDAVDFRAAHAELVRLKVDRNGARPSSDAWRKVIALWGNWVDDTCLALQARSQDHEERIVELEDAPVYTPTYGNTATVSDSTTTEGVATSVLRSDAVIPHGNRGGGALHANAVSGGAAGFMTGADKLALDDVVAGIVLATPAPVTISLATSPTNALSGTEAIGGYNFVVANEANATLFESNSSGLHFDASTNNNAFSTSAQTAPYVSITWATIFPSGFDPAGVYELSIRFTTLTIGTNGNKVNFGITNPASFTDTGHVSLARSGGVIVSRFEGAGASAQTGPSPGAADCLHLIVEANLIRGYFSTWASGFAARSAWTFVGQNTFATGTNADLDCALAPTTRVVIAGATGETGAAMEYVVSVLRARRIR